MNKDVVISIRGMHFQNTEDGDNIEVIQQGQYYMRSGMHYLVYDEPLEGTDAVIKNMLKFNDSSLSVTKKGPVSASMLFDTAQKNLTNYSTPFGSITMGIDTKSIDVKKEEDKLSLNVDYSLDVNYEFLADCHIHVVARNSQM